ncbi:hypothetical protein ACSBR2_029198 [Camellia fascicularis]
MRLKKKTQRKERKMHAFMGLYWTKPRGRERERERERERPTLCAGRVKESKGKLGKVETNKERLKNSFWKNNR